jgi:hypothetical protein
MINWIPEGRKKQCHPQRTWKDGMNSHEREVSGWANGTIEGSGVWKSEGVARHF